MNILEVRMSPLERLFGHDLYVVTLSSSISEVGIDLIFTYSDLDLFNTDIEAFRKLVKSKFRDNVNPAHFGLSHFPKFVEIQEELLVEDLESQLIVDFPTYPTSEQLGKEALEVEETIRDLWNEIEGAGN